MFSMTAEEEERWEHIISATATATATATPGTRWTKTSFPQAYLLPSHRDPQAFFDYIHAMDRLLLSAGPRFSRCTDPCPLCHPDLWLAKSL